MVVTLGPSIGNFASLVDRVTRPARASLTPDARRKIVAHAMKAEFKNGKVEGTEPVVGFGSENKDDPNSMDVALFSSGVTRIVVRKLVPMFILAISSAVLAEFAV